MKKYFPASLFILFLILVAFYYNYHEIIFKRPQSVHKWRQSDCASIALNYYQNGMKFFAAETHNLTSDGGTSGKCCTSEIPILYYAVASFYSVFGYHEYLFRIFNTLLFFLGLFFLFRLLYYLIKDSFWAIALSILFFTSPVLVYYGNNFLSNSSSLAFSIIAWYYFIRFLFESKQKWFYVSMVGFLIAAAFKVTALFSLFAITGVFGLELIGLIRLKEKSRLLNKPILYLGVIASIYLLIGLWLVYAHKYNQNHDCTYFSTTIFPVWELDREGIHKVLNRVQNVWLDQYFHKSVLLFLSICFIFIMWCFRKNSKVLIFSILFIALEIVVYIVLQFWTFADHDYYTIDMYILPILIIASTAYLLKKIYNKVFSSQISKVIFVLFLLFNIYYAHQKNNDRYNGWMNDYSKHKDIYSITSYLRQLGISPNDTVVSIPDVSNASLYLMNQKGWTEYTDARFNRGEKIRYNQNSAGVQKSIDKGAKYLIVNGIEELYSKPYLQQYSTHLMGKYNNVLVFDLKESNKNFDLEMRTVNKRYHCGAELQSGDKQLFISETDSVFFNNGTTQSEEFAHSGIYSSKLNIDSPYGMTINLKDLKYGESFKISVWRIINGESKGGIIASNSTSPYYNNRYEIVETDSNGWEKIAMELFIPIEMNNQEIGIYLYNPNKEFNYFDDFEIIRYKSVFEVF